MHAIQTIKPDTVFTLYLAHTRSSGYHTPEWSCIHLLPTALEWVKADV